MQARMKNPGRVLPGAMEAIMSLKAVVDHGGVPESTLQLVHLRASQITGWSVCVVMAAGAKAERETDERLLAVAAWRDAPYFTDAERAALALAEAVTRLSDREDPVPDDHWNEAAAHFTAKQLAGLLLWIATTNVFNRLNVSTRQAAGAWG